jgi:uroporphyrinogen-III synthase
MSEDPPLFGHTVLVTRPSHQAKQLCAGIEKAGGNALRCPAIEILPPKDVEDAREQLKQLKNFDLVVFISVNAVESALVLMAPVRLPQNLQLAAVGISTADCLKKHGYENIIHPQRQFDSEGLLQTEGLSDVAGKRVAVIRGDRGRQWLAKQLEKAGAEVVPVPVYRRKLPVDSQKTLQQALQDNDITIVTATSNEGLSNTTKMADNLRHKITHLPLVVLSERNKNYALELGYKNEIFVAGRASNQAIVETLIKLADSMRYT